MIFLKQFGSLSYVESFETKYGLGILILGIIFSLFLIGICSPYGRYYHSPSLEKRLARQDSIRFFTADSIFKSLAFKGIVEREFTYRCGEKKPRCRSVLFRTSPFLSQTKTYPIEDHAFIRLLSPDKNMIPVKSVVKYKDANNVYQEVQFLKGGTVEKAVGDSTFLYISPGGNRKYIIKPVLPRRP